MGGGRVGGRRDFPGGGQETMGESTRDVWRIYIGWVENIYRDGHNIGDMGMDNIRGMGGRDNSSMDRYVRD